MNVKYLGVHPGPIASCPGRPIIGSKRRENSSGGRVILAATVDLVKKICLTGDPAVGKTCLIRRFVVDEFDDSYITTIGAKVTKKRLVVAFPERAVCVNLSLMIWDVAGQKEYRQFHEMYLRGMEGVIAVADLTRKSTFSGLDAAIRLADRTGTDVPMIFLLNKCDLADPSFDELKDIRTAASQHGIPVLVTSARTGTNVELAFEKMGRMVADVWLNKKFKKSTSGMDKLNGAKGTTLQ